jgi:hypothetical protein
MDFDLFQDLAKGSLEVRGASRCGKGELKSARSRASSARRGACLPARCVEKLVLLNACMSVCS